MSATSQTTTSAPRQGAVVAAVLLVRPSPSALACTDACTTRPVRPRSSCSSRPRSTSRSGSPPSRSVLALVQLLTALRLYGKLRIPRKVPAWLGDVHRLSGTLALLFSLPVAYHCLWALGFERDSRPDVGASCTPSPDASSMARLVAKVRRRSGRRVFQSGPFPSSAVPRSQRAWSSCGARARSGSSRTSGSQRSDVQAPRQPHPGRCVGLRRHLRGHALRQRAVHTGHTRGRCRRTATVWSSTALPSSPAAVPDVTAPTAKAALARSSGGGPTVARFPEATISAVRDRRRRWDCRPSGPAQRGRDRRGRRLHPHGPRVARGAKEPGRPQRPSSVGGTEGARRSVHP